MLLESWDLGESQRSTEDRVSSFRGCITLAFGLMKGVGGKKLGGRVSELYRSEGEGGSGLPLGWESAV